MGERSLSNSGGVLHQAELVQELQSDWVRPGIMLYGGTPGGASGQGLRPAADHDPEIRGHRHPAPAGRRHRRLRQPLPGRAADAVGVVACGYADGYPRHAEHGTPVLVDGVRTTLVGRVSMDMMTVDLTPVPNAHIGSR
jgi:alanine racemase